MMGAVQEQLLAAIGDQRGVGAADRLCAACATMFGIDAVAVSLVYDGVNIGTLGASGPTARMYDEAQFTCGEGPCLDAVAHRTPVFAADLADPAENRWPAYSPAMLSYRVRGVFAMPIMVAGVYVGALDLFQTEPTTLHPEQIAGLAVAAELAQTPMRDLLHETVLDDAVTPGTRAWTELNSLTRAEVSQATGMVMAQLKVNAPAALVRPRAHAYATGRSATEVACDIIDRRLRLEPH